MSKELVMQSAALRGSGQFQEAIDLIESNLSTLDEETRLPALLNAFYAAIEAGFLIKAKELALLVAREDPNVPSIQPFLA